MRMRSCLKMNFKIQISTGFSLVELLIAMALMGFVTLSIANFLVKSNVMSSSLDMRFKAANEIQSLFLDIQRDLHQGAYISNNSHGQRLEYTTYDNNGNATKKIYRIITISSKTYLQISTDGGTSWNSPYRISDYTKYQVSGTSLFLYAQSGNNCTNFADTNANGAWENGVDVAGVTASCGSTTSTSPLLSTPSLANKIVLSGFQFTTGIGSPVVSRTLPSSIFITIPQKLVISTSAAVSPAVKDSPLVKSFDTNTTNSLFSTNFDIRGAKWDPSHDRLILVGHHSSGACKLYVAERNGIIYQPALSTLDSNIQLNGVALESDDKTILALDDSAKKLYRFSISSKIPQSPISTLNLASPSNLINTPTGLTYDPGTPNDFYIVGADPSGGALKIFERAKKDGALVGTAWTLPAAFDASHPPGGISIEPTSGDFLVVRNYVNGSAPNQTIDIYRIVRATGSSTWFSVNISDLSSSATGTTGNWGIAYDAETNHLFLSDSATDKVYEIIPNLLISPQS
jgi:prepilin-type N-terminal cleavage/methylation domain-containing protein